MAMMEKMKSKLPGAKQESSPEPAMEKKKAMPGIEIEIESEGEAEDSLASESEAEGEEEEVAVGELAKLSDEELLAEVKKRGLEVASGGASVTPLPEAGTEGEEMPEAKKKSVKV